MDTIKSCFENFQRSLQVLVPIFENADISWKNEEQYDEFDDVAQALFSSFVLKDIEARIDSIKAFNIKYDFGSFTGTENEYFLVKCSNINIVGRFCKYVTISRPFDSIEIFINSDNTTTVDATQADFEFVYSGDRPNH